MTADGGDTILAEVISLTTLNDAATVENPPGIFRTTLSYGEESMLCHFKMTKGSKIPLHNHPAVQNGYVVSGKIRFNRGQTGETFVAEAGSAYFFISMEYHGAEVLEEAEVIEVFSPMRPEYAP